jgi:hypothetical protein
MRSSNSSSIDSSAVTRDARSPTHVPANFVVPLSEDCVSPGAAGMGARNPEALCIPHWDKRQSVATGLFPALSDNHRSSIRMDTAVTRIVTTGRSDRNDNEAPDNEQEGKQLFHEVSPPSIKMTGGIG